MKEFSPLGGCDKELTARPSTLATGNFTLLDDSISDAYLIVIRIIFQPRPKKKPVTKKVAPAPLAVKKPVVKKVVNQLFEKRPKNFGIGK